MNRRLPLLTPAASPLECSSWLQREDLTRLALKAYEMARRGCEPDSEPFMVAGDAFSDRRTFRDALVDNLALLLDRHGLELGCWPGVDGLDRLELLEGDYRRRLAFGEVAA